mmetsp:Transcript_2518/g.7386  ORF Transcript_2518/g.7386 Transcript_2518/m.7386 type:complete len:234 (-) Transcript_2518:1361-2062(-)
MERCRANDLLFVVLVSPQSSDSIFLESLGEGGLDCLLDLRGGDTGSSVSCLLDDRGALLAPSFPVAKNRSTTSAARNTPSSIEYFLDPKGIGPPRSSSFEDVVPLVLTVPVFSSSGSTSFSLALDRRFVANSSCCFLSLDSAIIAASLALASTSLALAAAISASFFSALSRFRSSVSIRRSVTSRALSRFLISFLILADSFFSDLFADILASDLEDLTVWFVLFDATVGACEY